MDIVGCDMKFEFSKAVALQAEDVSAAQYFYSEVLGFPLTEEGGLLAVDADPLTMYFDEKKHCSGLLMELIVDDADAARDHLVAHGCEVVVWNGAGQSCIVRDPFGVHYNIYQR